jgi:hypothetical protein
MRTAFEILPASFDATSCTLFCEISNEGFSFCIKDETNNSFLGLAIYNYDKSKPLVGFPIDLQIVFHEKKEILSQRFNKVIVAYSFPQSVLIPFSLYNSEKNSTIMNLMHGDFHANEIILTDLITEHLIYNCYRIPAALHEVVQEHYPNALSTHQYSLLLKQTVEGKDNLSVIFYGQKLIVSLTKDGKHQLINSYRYSTPEDASYILLNICHQNSIENIGLKISGLIEEDSSLYKEIYKYFTEIEFTKLPDGLNFSEEIKHYPSHYFSYLFSLDSCV